MSDQSEPIIHPADERRTPRPAGIYEHFCEMPGCGKWGAFGYTRSKFEIEWFCFEHAQLRADLRSPIA